MNKKKDCSCLLFPEKQNQKDYATDIVFQMKNEIEKELE